MASNCDIPKAETEDQDQQKFPAQDIKNVDYYISLVEQQIPPGKWGKLGISLGIDDVTMRDIYFNYSLQGIQEVIHNTFVNWKNAEGSRATSSALISALNKAGLNHLFPAQYIKNVDDYILLVEQQIPPNKWQKLGRSLGIDDVTLYCIHCDYFHEGIKEVIHQTIVKWKNAKGSRATSLVLCSDLTSALYKAGLNRLVDPSYKESAKQSICPNRYDVLFSQDEQYYISQVSKSLRARYKNLELPGVPWEESVLPMEELYVDLTLHDVDKFGIQNSAKNITLEEMFLPLPGHDNIYTDEKRNLVIARPGYGKTSLLKKIAYDWATGKQYLSRFELVIFVQLRHIENRIKELIEEEGQLSVDPQPLYPFLDKIQSRSLLLLDGYDELPSSAHDDLHNLLQSKAFPDITIVMTSRTEPAKVQDVPIFWNKLIWINGFTEERAKTFLSKYLQTKDTEDTWKKIDILLSRNKATLLACPLFLLLFGKRVEDDEIQVITTRTELYMVAFNFIVRRSLIRKGILQPDQPFDMFCSFHQNSTRRSKLQNFFRFFKQRATKKYDALECFDVLRTFGKFAWNRINSESVFFKKSVLLENCKDEMILEMGILMQSTQKTNSRQHEIYYEPVHKIFMEFAAALYLAQRLQTENLKKIENEIRKANEVHILSILSCFQFVDVLLKQNTSISLIALLKDVLVKSRLDFDTDNIWKMSHYDEMEIEEICRELKDVLRLSATVGDEVNSFILARLKLKQIRVLICSDGINLPIKSIDVDSLIIFDDELKIVKSISTIFCKHIDIYISVVMYREDLWDRLRALFFLLQNKPSVSLFFDDFSPGHLKQLSALQNVKLHTVRFKTSYLKANLLSDLQNGLANLELIKLEFNYINWEEDCLEDFLDILTNASKVKKQCFPLSLKTFCPRNLLKVFKKFQIILNYATFHERLPDTWPGYRNVHEIILNESDLGTANFSLWPDLQLLWVINSENFDVANLSLILNVLKSKNKTLKQVTIADESRIDHPFLKIAVHNRENSLKDISSLNSSYQKHTIIDKVVICLLHLKHDLLDKVHTHLLSKEVCRVYITESATTVYELQKIFQRPKFQIECIYLESNFSYVFEILESKIYYLIKLAC